jgi:hypothetical protein
LSKYIKKIVDLNRYTTDSEANVKLSYKTLEAISSLWVKVADNPVTPTVPDVTRAIGVQTTSRDIANYTKIVDHFLNLLMKSTNRSKYKYDLVFTSNPEIDPEGYVNKKALLDKYTELKNNEPAPFFETKYRASPTSSWIDFNTAIFTRSVANFETDNPSIPTVSRATLSSFSTPPVHQNPAYIRYNTQAIMELRNLCVSRSMAFPIPGALDTFEDFKDDIILALGTPAVKQKKIRSSNPIEGVIPKTDDEYFIIDLVKLVNTKTAPPPGMPRENYEYILNKSGVLTWAGVSETDPSVYNPALLPYDPNKFAVSDVEKAENTLNRDMSIPASMGGFILANVLALRASMIASITATVESNFDLDGGQIAIQEMFSAFTPRQAKLFNARGLESYVANDGTVRFDVDKTMDYLKQMANYEGVTQFFDKRTQLKLSKLIDYPIESYDASKGVKSTTPYKDFIKNASYEQLVDPTIITLIRNIARQIAVEIGKLEIKLVRYQRRQRIDKINKAGE